MEKVINLAQEHIRYFEEHLLHLAGELSKPQRELLGRFGKEAT